VKYFVYGSVAAAVMIYGMSILYGLTGTTNILAIADIMRAHPLPGPAMYLAVVLILVGFGFKIAMVPFHQWAPDTYEGAPTPITAFLSVGSKAAGFAVLVRFLGSSIVNSGAFHWTPLIIVLSGITMTVGNLIAIPQNNIKRMLAYSSIAQAGYLLLGVATLGLSTNAESRTAAVQSILLYLFVYLFMNLGAFAVVTLLGTRLGSDDMRDYAGMIKRAPWAAVSMLFFMLSLAGIPPTAGFLGKFYLFFAAIKVAQETGSSALMWLSVVAIANTVVSVYYYFNIVRQMFFGQEKIEKPIQTPNALKLAIGATLVMTVLILVLSPVFLEFAKHTAGMLF
jgi:proton-translocating NADH-quinone oxidoreductase chain N